MSDPGAAPGGEADRDWPVILLQHDFEVRETRAMPELSPALEVRVASIWQDERRTRPRLFNGTVFSADRITAAGIEGHWTEYRRALAQLRAPALFDGLRIRALAVTGLLECADGIVLARREAGSVYQPGTWQSPPAGSVERRSGTQGGGHVGGAVDLEAQILDECEEELGLPARDLAVLRPVLAIEHPGSRIVDVGMTLRTERHFSAVEAAWRVGGNREYDRLALLTSPGPALMPTTRALIAATR